MPQKMFFNCRLKTLVLFAFLQAKRSFLMCVHFSINQEQLIRWHKQLFIVDRKQVLVPDGLSASPQLRPIVTSIIAANCVANERLLRRSYAGLKTKRRARRMTA